MLFAVGPQKPEHDGLMQTLVRLLIKKITPAGEQIVGGWQTAVKVRPALGDGFGGQW